MDKFTNTQQIRRIKLTQEAQDLPHDDDVIVGEWLMEVGQATAEEIHAALTRWVEAGRHARNPDEGERWTATWRKEIHADGGRFEMEHRRYGHERWIKFRFSIEEIPSASALLEH